MIETKAFYSCTCLGSVSIPGTVSTIGESAFAECRFLDNVSIGSGVKTIGESAFMNLDYLERIVIPGSVSAIGDQAFSGCFNVRSISIGYGVTNIGQSAFSGCIKVKSLVIPDCVEVIGNKAFENCAGLTAVSLTEELHASIDSSVFAGCSELTTESYTHLAINPFAVSGKTATLKAKKLKKKAQSVAVGKVLGITPSGTGIECIKLSGNKNISINKTTGTVSVKKKTKKGTYSVRINIRSTGNATYRASDWQTVTFKIKVKK